MSIAPDTSRCHWITSGGEALFIPMCMGVEGDRLHQCTCSWNEDELRVRASVARRALERSLRVPGASEALATIADRPRGTVAVVELLVPLRCRLDRAREGVLDAWRRWRATYLRPEHRGVFDAAAERERQAAHRRMIAPWDRDARRIEVLIARLRELAQMDMGSVAMRTRRHPLPADPGTLRLLAEATP